MTKVLVLLVILLHVEQPLPVHSANLRPTMNSVTDFEDLVRCTTFVDKTAMINTFFNNMGHRQFLMITCPRKFGKSTNLKMMKSFVEMSIDENGEMIKNVSLTEAFHMFTNPVWNLRIRGALLSMGDLYHNHFKKYAVIHVSFKIFGGSDYQHVVKVLQDRIRTCYETYEWVYKKLLMNHPNSGLYSVKGKQIKFMEKVLSGKMDEDDVICGLYELSKILYENVNRDVFLLIDDYDAPIFKAFEHSEKTVHIGRLIERIVAKLLNADHTYVKYALITGTSNLFKSKFTNIRHVDFLEPHPFVEYFGFNGDEVRTLFAKHDLSINDTRKIRRQYKSYEVINTNIHIYNPFSVVNCLANRDTENDGQIQNYWTHSGEVPNFIEFLKKYKICALIGELVVKRKLRFILYRNIGTTELDELTVVASNQSKEISVRHVDLFLSYLYENGYLSRLPEQNMFTIPNKEIESYYLRNQYVFYSDYGDLNLEEIRNAIASIIANADADNLVRFNCEQVLESTFRKKFSSYQFTKMGDYHFQSIVYCAAKQNRLVNGDISLVDLDEGKTEGIFMVVEVKNKVVFLLELKFDTPVRLTERDEKLRIKRVCHRIIEQKIAEDE